jgi:hypothetical protein
MRVFESDLDDEIALRCSAVGGGFVFVPGEFGGNGHVGAAAYAGHPAKENFEALGIGIENAEHVGFAVSSFILRFAGAESGGEAIPMTEEAAVCHLKDAADVRGLVLVEEDVSGWSITVGSVFAVEETEGDKSVEEVASRAGMKAKAASEGLSVSGPRASSVKTSISTALRRVLEAQKARPVCRM